MLRTLGKHPLKSFPAGPASCTRCGNQTPSGSAGSLDDACPGQDGKPPTGRLISVCGSLKTRQRQNKTKNRKCHANKPAAPQSRSFRVPSLPSTFTPPPRSARRPPPALLRCPVWAPGRPHLLSGNFRTWRPSSCCHVSPTSAWTFLFGLPRAAPVPSTSSCCPWTPRPQEPRDHVSTVRVAIPGGRETPRASVCVCVLCAVGPCVCVCCVCCVRCVLWVLAFVKQLKPLDLPGHSYL